MALRDDLLGLGTLRDQLATDLGMRRYSVTVRHEEYSSAIADGLAPPTITDVPLLPAPPVVKLNDELASWHGGGVVATQTGRLTLLVFKIGPIPLNHPDGGYSAADLRPEPAGPNERVVYMITGPDVPDGAAFVLSGQAGSYTEGAFGTTLIVKQAAPVEEA